MWKQLLAAYCASGFALGAVAESILGPHQVLQWKDDVLTENLPIEWRQLLQPIGTVCVTGDDRIGKSTLLSLWGQQLTNEPSFQFSTGHTRTQHTQGIWSAIALSNATGLPFHVNLCDSQGLKQLSELQQRRLFATNVLLPSVLVYVLINVLQTDQLRDLARMAYHFKQLSHMDLGRFGQVLSPHLIVVVREESDLEGQLSDHLEEALNGTAYMEDKQLIQQVFVSREAWPLQELPMSARKALRADPGKLADLPKEEAGPWKESGLAVLKQVLTALHSRVQTLPEGGPQLAEWHRSVGATVAGGDSESIGRLIGHGESLRAAGHRRRILESFRGPAVLIVASMMWLSGIGGFLGRLLDRVAWCAWMASVMSYVATSPYLTSPLQIVVPAYCEALAVQMGSPALTVLVCREASTFTAALLLAALLGSLTYPLLSQRLWWLCRWMPLPSPLRGSLVMLVAGIAVGFFHAMQDIDLDSGISPAAATWWYASVLVLLATAGLACAEFCLRTMGNVRRTKASEAGRALHQYVANRLDEVGQLEQSKAWTTHYKAHSRCDANWRLRRSPAWDRAALACQSMCLLAWAVLIFPHCDVVLAGGAAANVLHLLWRLCKCVAGYIRQRGMDEVDCWWAQLEDLAKDAEQQEESPEGKEAVAPEETSTPAGDVGKAPQKRKRRSASPGILPETEEDACQRRKIEEMRIAQEKLRRWK